MCASSSWPCCYICGPGWPKSKKLFWILIDCDVAMHRFISLPLHSIAEHLCKTRFCGHSRNLHNITVPLPQKISCLWVNGTKLRLWAFWKMIKNESQQIHGWAKRENLGRVFQTINCCFSLSPKWDFLWARILRLPRGQAPSLFRELEFSFWANKIREVLLPDFELGVELDHRVPSHDFQNLLTLAPAQTAQLSRKSLKNITVILNLFPAGYVTTTLVQK